MNRAMNRIGWFWAGVLGMAATASAEVSVSVRTVQELPYGHPDFFPSHNRPLGFLADGNGHFPGATPPDFGALGANCVAWKTPMPSPSMAAPLVVGEKVFVLGDYFNLHCLSIHDGKILWTRNLSPAHDLPPPLAANFDDEVAYYDAWAKAYCRWHAVVTDFFKQKDALTDEVAKQQAQALWEGKDAPRDQIPAPLLEQHQRQKALNTGEFFYHSPGSNAPLTRDAWHKWRERMRNLYNLHTWTAWYGFVTKTYAQPCTDGENVYVWLSCNHVACVSLEGELRWLRWLPNDFVIPALDTRFVSSPQLYGDLLVCYADAHTVAVDKRTGALRWRHEGMTFNSISRPHPEAGTISRARVALPDKTTLDVVIDPISRLFRLEDGKPLGELPWEKLGVEKRMGAHNYHKRIFLAWGDTVVGIYQFDESGRKTVAWGVRLTATGRDAVTCTILWRHDNRANSCPFAYDGKVVAGIMDRERPSGLIDPLSGEITPIAGGEGIHVMWEWPIVAGQAFIGARYYNPKIEITSFPSDNHQAFFKKFGAQDLRSGKLSACPPLRDEQFADNPDFRLRWAHRGSCKFFGQGQYTAQANRILFRSFGTTWCLGDSSQPFPVNAAWPKAARLATSVDRTKPRTVDESDIIAAFRESSQDRRRAAIATLASMKTVPAVVIRTLIAQHADAFGSLRNDLACALGTIGAPAAAAAPLLGKDVVEADRGMAVMAGWALGRMGESGVSGLPPIKAWLDAEFATNRDFWKGEHPMKRMLAAGLALGGVEGVAALESTMTKAGPNRGYLQWAKDVLTGELAKGPLRPFPMPAEP